MMQLVPSQASQQKKTMMGAGAVAQIPEIVVL
jgi:hypothetical protein